MAFPVFGARLTFCVLARVCAFAVREVHVLRAREGLQRPVDEAVEEDEAGAASPDHQDDDEGGTQIVDHLQAGADLQSTAGDGVQRPHGPKRYLDARESDG